MQANRNFMAQLEHLHRALQTLQVFRNDCLLNTLVEIWRKCGTPQNSSAPGQALSLGCTVRTPGALLDQFSMGGTDEISPCSLFGGFGAHGNVYVGSRCAESRTRFGLFICALQSERFLHERTQLQRRRWTVQIQHKSHPGDRDGSAGV